MFFFIENTLVDVGELTLYIGKSKTAICMHKKYQLLLPI